MESVRAATKQQAPLVTQGARTPHYPRRETLILPALEAELTRRLKVELDAGRGREDDFVLVMPRTGRPPHQRNLQHAVIDAALSAGIGHVTPQTLRRTFASIAARRIPDPAEAVHMTGHSLDTWVRYYVDRFGSEARQDARKRLLEGGLGARDLRGPLTSR